MSLISQPRHLTKFQKVFYRSFSEKGLWIWRQQQGSTPLLQGATPPRLFVFDSLCFLFIIPSISVHFLIWYGRDSEKSVRSPIVYPVRYWINFHHQAYFYIWGRAAFKQNWKHPNGNFSFRGLLNRFMNAQLYLTVHWIQHYKKMFIGILLRAKSAPIHQLTNWST